MERLMLTRRRTLARHPIFIIAQSVVTEPVRMVRIGLVSVGEHDAEVVFRMLKEVLCRHAITRR
jgi:hypothetical protein